MENNSNLHDGNVFFRHKYPSIDIERAIKSIETFEEFEKFYTNDLMDGNVLLRDYLYELLERHNVKADTVSTEIGYSHDYVRMLATGKRDNPEREVILAICVYIQTTIEETQNLLRYAGQQPLYARRKRDAIIWYALQKVQSSDAPVDKKKYFDALNDYLYSKNYKTLGKH